MVIAKRLDSGPITKLEVVKGTRKTDPMPLPPISPATAIRSKRGHLWWQLQFDFTRPVEPLHARPGRKRKAPRPAKPPVDLSDGKKRTRLQILNVLTHTETQAEKSARLEKGLRDRRAFLEWIEFGTASDSKGRSKPVYDRFLDIVASETRRNLNRTQSLRGRAREDEEGIWMDLYHDTILKVAEALEDGLYKSDDGRFDNYFFTFLKLDTERGIQNMDRRNMQHRYIFADHESDEKRDIWGELGAMLSEVPAFMEGRLEEFRSYAFHYIMDFVSYRLTHDAEEVWDAQVFRMYYGTLDRNGRPNTLRGVADYFGCSENKIRDAKNRVLEYVQAHVTAESVWQDFGVKVAQGCGVCSRT